MNMIYEPNHNILKSQYKVIYGAGRSGEQLLMELLQMGLNIDYFCDSSEEKIGKIILGKKVLSINDLHEIKDETAILVGRAYSIEIAEKLMAEGFENIYMALPENGIIIE